MIYLLVFFSSVLLIVAIELYSGTKEDCLFQSRTVASHEWYVKKICIFEKKKMRILQPGGWSEEKRSRLRSLIFGGGYAFVLLSSCDSNRNMFFLGLPAGHPSLKGLEHFTYLDRMEFHFSESPLKPFKGHCAYLQIKNGSLVD